MPRSARSRDDANCSCQPLRRTAASTTSRSSRSSIDARCRAWPSRCTAASTAPRLLQRILRGGAAAPSGGALMAAGGGAAGSGGARITSALSYAGVEARCSFRRRSAASRTRSIAVCDGRAVSSMRWSGGARAAIWRGPGVLPIKLGHHERPHRLTCCSNDPGRGSYPSIRFMLGARGPPRARESVGPVGRGPQGAPNRPGIDTYDTPIRKCFSPPSRSCVA